VNLEQEPLEQQSFTELTDALEALVTQLQQESLPLEEAISAYERGMQLIREAQQRLDSAEQKVQLLTADGETTAVDADAPDLPDRS
jgi:exodeoxyribonuclease VII small subunit